MKLYVTGAAGMLGRDVVLAAENAGHEVRGFDRVSLDVNDAEKVKRRFTLDRPDAVINCAGWTDVDGAEEDPEAAFLANETGAAIVASAAAEAGAKVLYVSTDYVFDGSKGSPYVETDPPAPLSVYGRSKLAGEEATVKANSRSFVVRSSGLFGIRGPNFVVTMLRLGRTSGKVLVEGFFADSNDAAARTLKAAGQLCAFV